MQPDSIRSRTVHRPILWLFLLVRLALSNTAPSSPPPWGAFGSRKFGSGEFGSGEFGSGEFGSGLGEVASGSDEEYGGLLEAASGWPSPPLSPPLALTTLPPSHSPPPPLLFSPPQSPIWSSPPPPSHSPSVLLSPPPSLVSPTSPLLSPEGEELLPSAVHIRVSMLLPFPEGSTAAILYHCATVLLLCRLPPLSSCRCTALDGMGCDAMRCDGVGWDDRPRRKRS